MKIGAPSGANVFKQLKRLMVLISYFSLFDLFFASLMFSWTNYFSEIILICRQRTNKYACQILLFTLSRLDELLAEDAEGEEPGKARLARKLEESLVGVATERQARILDRN